MKHVKGLLSPVMQEQLEQRFSNQIRTSFGRLPWRRKHHRTKRVKVWLHRQERRRAKLDPECLPHYRKFRGYEW